MKYIITSILLITINAKSCKSQQSYKEIIVNSEAEPNWKGYIDNSSIFYQSGKAWGVTTKVIFDATDYFKTDSSFTILGQVVANTNGTVRHGFCCFNIFLAEVKGDSLVNIKRVGITNDKNENPNKSDGHFEIIIKPSKGQRLFFASPGGEGLHEYSLDKLMEKSKKKTFYKKST